MMHAITPVTTPSFRKMRPNCVSRPCSRYSAPTDDITNAAVTTAPHILCAYCSHAQGFIISPQKLETSYVPFGSRWYATGCCIHASVTMMKNPEIHEPTNTRNAAPQCASLESRFSPNRNRPRKLDSRKNENTPSIASGCPITPPVRRENSLQLVPNWNSIGMPVTTPSRKLMAKIFAQNRAATLYFSLPVRSAIVFKITSSSASPIVSCGNR
jgi:hypothetical protein